ncbi:MAG: hypothetical protein M1833_003028 [Piccolia ochrophora]|nr:MAG: hypothetical protein M1833_003028 [Piccolia ochrophora]
MSTLKSFLAPCVAFGLLCAPVYSLPQAVVPPPTQTPDDGMTFQKAGVFINVSTMGANITVLGHHAGSIPVTCSGSGSRVGATVWDRNLTCDDPSVKAWFAYPGVSPINGYTVQVDAPGFPLGTFDGTDLNDASVWTCDTQPVRDRDLKNACSTKIPVEGRLEPTEEQPEISADRLPNPPS